MGNETFFDNQTASSKIKASIVSEYFPSYCKIIVNKYMPNEIRFIDLFAGPGIYQDGNISTPILIAKQCQQDSFLKSKVRLIFNDKEYTENLKTNFNSQFPDGTFSKKPHFGNKTVGQDENIRKFLLSNTHVGKNNESPSLLFIDPFGYKGIETSVLAQFLKNWGNEIFLFINIKRIHPALENDKFEDLMKDLFPTTLKQVKEDRRYLLSVPERINLIIQSLGKEYESILKSKIFYTAFKFQEEDSDATSHYILHITKGSRGFDLVKTIYNDFANVGTVFDGINTYTFDAKKLENETVELFDMKSINIDNLKDSIYLAYKDKSLTAHQLFEEHQIKNLYSRNHYTTALRELVTEQKLISNYTDNKLHRFPVLISKECVLTFK
ncbi:MAG: three-Cys-motif partner protein TcmP [Bacteroidetes bacterium]|nr:three-Cys-motif partner protein TcmP [Bacteroidota bacterium]